MFSHVGFLTPQLQVEKLANTFNFTSEQHVDHRDSRIKIDIEHTEKLLG